MGMIYEFSCNNCSEIRGTTYYGVGMMFPETNEDFRLFNCYDCGEVFERNINKKFNRCPKCKKKPMELIFLEKDEYGYNEKIKSDLNCPNCNKGNLIIENVGCWD